MLPTRRRSDGLAHIRQHDPAVDHPLRLLILWELTGKYLEMAAPWNPPAMDLPVISVRPHTNYFDKPSQIRLKCARRKRLGGGTRT